MAFKLCPPLENSSPFENKRPVKFILVVISETSAPVYLGTCPDFLSGHPDVTLESGVPHAIGDLFPSCTKERFLVVTRPGACYYYPGRVR